MRALAVFASVLLPSIPARKELLCASTASHTGDSLIQVRASNASSASPAAHLQVRGRVNGDVLMAVGSDDDVAAATAAEGNETKAWPFDVIGAAISNSVEAITSKSPLHRSKKSEHKTHAHPSKAGHFQKLKTSELEADELNSATNENSANSAKSEHDLTNEPEIEAYGSASFRWSNYAGLLTYEQLPIQLQSMGENFFGSKENVMVLLENTKVSNITYGGTVVTIAYRNSDDITSNYCDTCLQGDEYGLERLLEQATETDKAFEEHRQSSLHKMMNIIDIGGHIGVVSIAAYKKYPRMVRAAVVEPVRLSHFFLNVNMWLNNVPSIPVDADGRGMPGITTILKVIDADTDQPEQICVPGLATNTFNAFPMNLQTLGAQACNCCDDGCPDACVDATSTTTDMIFGLFPDEDITLLKVNCEGCENHVLAALDNPLLRVRVKKLAVEMHNQESTVAQQACVHPNHQVRGICPQSNNEILNEPQYCQVCTV